MGGGDVISFGLKSLLETLFIAMLKNLQQFGTKKSL
jgi:hypothetical protein